MSGSVNIVTLIGRLGRDPEIRSTQSGTEIANFTLATDESWKDRDTGEKREKTEWHRVVVFGGLVEVIKNYINKGDLIFIQGKIQTRKWEDQEGNDRYSTEIVLDPYNGKLTMLGGKGASSGSKAASERPAQPERNDDDDEIPF